MAPFSLSRATTSDMMELAELMYRNFRPWVVARIMGLFSEEDVPKVAEMYKRIMLEDPTDIWMKVIDKETGKIAAATNWKLYLAPESTQKRTRLQPPEWLDEEWTKESKMLLEALNEAKIKANQDPFLRQSLMYEEDRWGWLKRSRPEYMCNGSGTA
jgi:hypothetical protein